MLHVRNNWDGLQFARYSAASSKLIFQVAIVNHGLPGGRSGEQEEISSVLGDLKEAAAR